ncbi:TolC family protein [Bacteriovoracaceae bacterium]|nr:TolC family protein [Bacteriovoracaceae bacterium]
MCANVLAQQGMSNSQVQSFGSAQGSGQMLGQAQDDIFNQAEAKKDLKLKAKTIGLRTVLSMGLNKNVDQKVRNYLNEKIELDWDDSFESFWFPDVNLTLNSGTQLVETLRRSSSVDTTSGKVPTGSLSLDLGNYTVFNWGRDYLEYVNSKSTYQRNKQKLNEQRRQLRFNLISQYFNLVKTKNIQRWRREQLRHTSFIHRLARQKLALKKITSQEYYQTRAEYLRAQTLFQESQASSIEEDESLAQLIGDNLETTYKPREDLKFIVINTSREESLRMALRQSPDYRDAKVDIENSNRSFQKSIKDNMPLPKFNLNLGAYKTSFSKSGRHTEYEGSNGGRDVEVVASINLTWNIVGNGGLFNSRDRKRAYLNKRMAEEKFFNTKRAINVTIRTIYRRMRFLERKSEVSDVQLKNAQSAFDYTLDNYISGKTNFANLKIALERTIEAYINYETAKYDHLVLKLELANLMGLEDFPGSNFENLAQRT